MEPRRRERELIEFLISDQAMLYATDGIDSESDLAKPMVGVANVWCELIPALAVQFRESR